MYKHANTVWMRLVQNKLSGIFGMYSAYHSANFRAFVRSQFVIYSFDLMTLGDQLSWMYNTSNRIFTGPDCIRFMSHNSKVSDGLYIDRYMGFNDGDGLVELGIYDNDSGNDIEGPYYRFEYFGGVVRSFSGRYHMINDTLIDTCTFANNWPVTEDITWKGGMATVILPDYTTLFYPYDEGKWTDSYGKSEETTAKLRSIKKKRKIKL